MGGKGKGEGTGANGKKYLKRLHECGGGGAKRGWGLKYSLFEWWNARPVGEPSATSKRKNLFVKRGHP